MSEIQYYFTVLSFIALMDVFMSEMVVFSNFRLNDQINRNTKKNIIPTLNNGGWVSMNAVSFYNDCNRVRNFSLGYLRTVVLSPCAKLLL
jgi:hypothetical protein